MDANVSARMNGGVSSRIGSTGDGIVMIFFALMKSRSLMHCIAERVEQLVRGGMILFQLGQNLLRRFVRIDLRGRGFEALLIRVQIVVADLQQAVERNVDHLFIRQLLRVILRAQPEIAVRLRKHVVLQKLLRNP